VDARDKRGHDAQLRRPDFIGCILSQSDFQDDGQNVFSRLARFSASIKAASGTPAAAQYAVIQKDQSL
jgi:hypothetical protein